MWGDSNASFYLGTSNCIVIVVPVAKLTTLTCLQIKKKIKIKNVLTPRWLSHWLTNQEVEGSTPTFRN